MKVQNSIELGTGGDNSIWGDGEFFKGAVTAGYPSDATENAVQASITAAGDADNTTFVPTTASVVSLQGPRQWRFRGRGEWQHLADRRTPPRSARPRPSTCSPTPTAP